MARVTRLLVAIPAWNEEASVGDVLTEVRRARPDATVLVVDDASTDNTAAVARAAGGTVLTMPFNVGVGGAMRTAYLYARDYGFDAVVQVDADGQHDASCIENLVAALSEASVVVGTRFADRGQYPVRGPRKWAMRLLSRVLSRVAGTDLTDTTSGFRAADRSAISLFARHYPAEYLGDTVESLIIAVRAGLTIRQVPVTMHTRRGGRPSQNPIWATLYLARALLALSVALTRRRDRENP